MQGLSSVGNRLYHYCVTSLGIDSVITEMYFNLNHQHLNFLYFSSQLHRIVK